MKRTGHGVILRKRKTTKKTTKDVPFPVLQTSHNHQYLLLGLAGYCIKLLQKSKNLA